MTAPPLRLPEALTALRDRLAAAPLGLATPEADLLLLVHLDDGDLRAKAQVVRTHARGARWIISANFVAIQEKDQDRVRRRVFQALREERANKA